jgi:hypothetical protein
MAELPIIEYDIFNFSLPPPHLEPEMEMKLVEFCIRFPVPDQYSAVAGYSSDEV